MPVHRNNLVQNPLPRADEITARCLTPLAWLDGELRFAWANAAWLEAFAPRQSRWLGHALETLDPGNAELMTAARRTLLEQQVVVLRKLRLRGILGGSDWLGDLGLTPLAEGGLLLEAHVGQSTVESAAPALSESLRGFAHEVKNPLAGVRGAAQLLARRVEDPSLRELAELIMAESDRLTTLADRLLRASGKPRLSRTNVHECLERVAALIEAEAAAPRVIRDYDPSLPTINGDRDRLQQLILNLARNAAEAEASTIIMRTRLEFGVRLNERLRRAVLRIDVIDDGHGIIDEIAETLYLPLVSGRANGSGLGLALAREIADEHGAELRHANRPGATTFSLFLPMEASA